MRTKLILGIAAIFIAGGAFSAGMLVDRYFLSAIVSGPRSNSPSATTNLPHPSSDPRREAFIQYLDGKTIALKDSKTSADENGTLHTIRKSQVEAVQFPSYLAKGVDEPWAAQVHFILNTSQQRYAVQCNVRWRDVESMVAFIAFEVTEVTKI